MKQYTLQAEIGSQITTLAINARDNFSAKVLATNKIAANYVSDKRYAIGKITLKDSNGKVVWEIEEEKIEPIKTPKEKEKGVR